MNKPMERFTFGILTYNQYDTILETLNSIKYQIQEYGKGIKINLIVVDDYSKDYTTSVVDKWLIQNEDLFFDIKRKYNKENVGVVKNYNYILNHINNEPFKIIAGDDLISSNNLFEAFQCVNYNTLYNGMRVYLKNGNLYVDKSVVQLHFFLMRKKMSKKLYFRLFKMGKVVSTPQTLFFKDMYIRAGCADYNKKFRLFEDNPTWYSMIKNINNIEIIYKPEVLVLYRISEKSISNRSETINYDFVNELYNLYDKYIEEGDIWDRLYFQSLKKEKNKLLKFSTYANILFKVKYAMYAIFHIKQYKRFEKYVSGFILREQEFYNKVHNM